MVTDFLGYRKHHSEFSYYYDDYYDDGEENDDDDFARMIRIWPGLFSFVLFLFGKSVQLVI